MRIYKCSVLGCSASSSEEDQILLHEAADWHCPKCGFSDYSEVEIPAEADIRYCGMCFDALNVPEQTCPGAKKDA